MNKTPKQREAIKIIAGNALHILLYGGSGSGKTDINLYALIVRCFKAKSRHAVLRQTFKEAKTAIGHESMPRLLERVCPEVTVTLNRSDWYWTFPNGSEIWLGGLDEKDRADKILGHEYSTIYFNECSQMQFDSVQTAITRLRESSGLKLRALYDCNPPLKKHWTYLLWFLSLNPKDMTALAKPELYAALLMNPYDNEANLPENYIRDFLEPLSERKRQRFLLGLFLDELEGALWNSNMISAYRVTADQVPDLVRVVVGVDPAVTSKITSDETGIVAVGRAADGHLYVLRDKSLRDTPRKWALATVACYKDVAADRVIGEVNNGGDLVEVNLNTVDSKISYKSVHASRGKMMRAEPVAALYEKGYVHHVGEFPDLEEEMCGYTGDPNEASPNRLDACVWACTELMGGAIRPHVFSTVDDRPGPEKRIDAELDELYALCSPEEQMELDRMMKE